MSTILRGLAFVVVFCTIASTAIRAADRIVLNEHPELPSQRMVILEADFAISS